MRYSRDPRDKLLTDLLACGGVGGLVVGAGPADVGGCWWAGGGGIPTELAERLDRGVLLDEERIPCPMSSKPVNIIINTQASIMTIPEAAQTFWHLSLPIQTL